MLAMESIKWFQEIMFAFANDIHEEPLKNNQRITKEPPKK